jgi:hypothetical protein
MYSISAILICAGCHILLIAGGGLASSQAKSRKQRCRGTDPRKD